MMGAKCQTPGCAMPAVWLEAEQSDPDVPGQSIAGPWLVRIYRRCDKHLDPTLRHWLPFSR